MAAFTGTATGGGGGGTGGGPILKEAVAGTIKCCLCGLTIVPNNAAMCMNCLKSEVDITAGIERECDIVQCGKCDKWQRKLDDWIEAEIESLPLLTLCMKRVPGLCTPDTKILDAKWIWTEPHSRRIKICVDIERMVLDEKVKLAQRVIVEFVVKKKQCNDCIHDATDHNFAGQVQIRQHISGKSRSLRNLEVLLRKAGLHKIMSDIEVRREGLDIKFKTKSGAEKVVAFVSSVMPCKVKYSKKMVSHNPKDGTAKQEHVYYVEIVPLSRDDLVLLPKDYTGSLELMIVSKMSSLIKLINPTTLNQIDISASKFFSKPFKAIASIKDAVEYMVMDVENANKFNTNSSNSSNHSGGGCGGKNSSSGNNSSNGKKSSVSGGGSNSKSSSNNISSGVDNDSISGESKQLFVAAEAEVMLESSIDGDSIFVSTHLGHLIQAGDSTLGYNLKVISNADEDLLSNLNYAPPDVILVKKIQPKDGGGFKPQKKKKKSRGGGKSSSTSIAEDTTEVSDNESMMTGAIDGDDDNDGIGDDDDDSIEGVQVEQFEDEADVSVDGDELAIDNSNSYGLSESIETGLSINDYSSDK